MIWTLDKSRQLYGIDQWGAGYFGINQDGHVVAYPSAKQHQHCIDLFHIADTIEQHDLTLPLLVRFIDVLTDRVSALIDAFSAACQQCDYQGQYLPVYPIKVNQHNTVIDGILDADPRIVGLEAGSRAELLANIALSRGGVIVCNGYKDKAYVELALIALRMGLRVFLVVEKLAELALILQQSERMQIEPLIGVRVRLSNLGDGRWQNSGGEKSKFGLGAGQLLSFIDQLKAAQRIACLQLMHFHIGSQVSHLASFEAGMQEACRFYAELWRLGARLTTLDVGGGLGVDYDGTHSREDSSINYSLADYAQVIVSTIKQHCDQHQLPHPQVITESGRAMTAHHALLITNAVEVESFPIIPISAERQDVSGESYQQRHDDYQAQLKQLRIEYTQGQLNLEQLATAEAQCYTALSQLRDELNRSDNTSGNAEQCLLDQLNQQLADKIFCNFSLFQSMPDVWAFEQIFPIMPLSRHQEEPSRRGIIQDLTCDSDGSIKNYVENGQIETTLRFHQPNRQQPYYLGFFLLGAYQEILGDMHNLFGDTNAINIHLDEDGTSHYFAATNGDSVADLLDYVHIDPLQVESIIQQKMRAARLADEEVEQYCIIISKALQAASYLE